MDGWPALEAAGTLFNTMVVKDNLEQPVLLFKNEWNVGQVQGDHPDLRLSKTAPVGGFTT
jgi:peptide chain release factor 3